MRQRVLGGDGDAIPFAHKLLVGAGVGGAAALLATPPDFVMVKTQGSGMGSGMGSGNGRPRRSPLRLAADVLRARGVRGVFRGAQPTAARAAVLTAVEQGVYDEAKGRLAALAPALGGRDHPACHTAAALAAGLATAVATSPLDVVKTRFMCAAPGTYAGPLACAAAVVRADGPRGLFRGFLPYYMQIGPWSLVMFLAYEAIGKLARRFDDDGG